MFGRISNNDLHTKMLQIEHKLDVILSSHQRIQDNIKYYIDDCFDKCIQEIKVVCGNLSTNDCESVASSVIQPSLVSLINNSTHEVTTKIDEFKMHVTHKVDTLFYENEMIKHQFLLEEEFHKYFVDLSEMKNVIDKSVTEVNEMLAHTKTLHRNTYIIYKIHGSDCSEKLN